MKNASFNNIIREICAKKSNEKVHVRVVGGHVEQRSKAGLLRDCVLSESGESAGG